MEIRFTQAARKHRIGRDERDRELEIVAVELDGDENRVAVLLVIHVMPTQLRGSDPPA